MWTDQDVERWLNDYPLPQGFKWRGEVAWPRYELKHGYGQWLRTAGSYHPALRGLFRLVCDVIKGWPDGAPLPSPDQLAGQLRAYETVQPSLGLDEPADAERSAAP